MPELKIRNLKNETIRTISLPDEVYAAPLHRQMLYEAVRQYRNNARAGTHDTKNRKDVSGGGKKPWRQKHTGRARHGSTRSPLWRKGGTVHGPTPRSYAFHLPRKVRHGALRSALSIKVRDERLVAVDSLEVQAPKTRELVRVLEEGLGISSRVLLVSETGSRNLELAARNNPLVKVVRPLAVNVYDLMTHDWVLASEAALGALTEMLMASRRTAAAGQES